MLKKLLKYDLKYMFKSLSILYIFTIIFAVLMNLCYSKTDVTIFKIIYIILAFMTFALLFTILSNNILKLWSRFINNIYKDESYLTHTLPVTKNEIYLSKILTSIITLFTSMFIILLTILIIFYPFNGLGIFKNLLDTFSVFSKSTTVNLIIIFMIFCIEIIYLIQVGYTGIILGHRKNNDKIIKSLIYGTICYIIISGLSLLFVYIMGLLNPKIIELFKTNQIPTKDIIKLLITGIMTFYIFIIIIFYILNVKLLKKGVNID